MITVPPGSDGMNPLYDVLTSAAVSLLAAAGGDLPEAEEAYMEAAFTAPDVFPPGSPLAAALNEILGAVRDMGRGVTA